MQSADETNLNLKVLAAFKIACLILVGYGLYLLLPLFLLIYLAGLLAITLEPLVAYLERKKFRRGLSIMLISLILLGLLTLFVVFLLPPVFSQIGSLIENLPSYREKLIDQFEEGSLARRAIAAMTMNSPLQGVGGWLKHLVTVGQITFEATFSFLFVLVLAMYLVLDGHKAYAWLLRFFSPINRKKIANSSQEISKVVFAYVIGQGITSLLAAIVSFGILEVCRVPGALTLALVAGVFDILPLLGFFLFTIPAVLLALTVSPLTALIVAALYLVYHAIENYLIVPRVYGARMRLSSLVVLISLAVGGLLAGIPGAIAVLPLVAAYPIIERIWLKDYLKLDSQ